ncbi:MAG: acetyltransferase [Lachnospiraceae bacterium]|nr:acetyltransferase [Lachnospiraceae bacterium]
MILAIYGAGGLGQQVSEMAERWYATRWERIVFINDLLEKQAEQEGHAVMPYRLFVKQFSGEDTEFLIASGEPDLRREYYERITGDGFHLTTLIHPEAEVSPTAVLGDGIIALRGCVINHHAQVGTNTCLMINSVIGHDSVIAPHCQISTFVSIGGHCSVGECTFFGLQASLRDTVSVGRYVIVGEGTHVLKAVQDEVVVMGNPGKPCFMNSRKRVFR